MLSLADLIQALLFKRGMSARALSIKAGLSPGYVSKVIGGMNPSLKAFALIVEALECSNLEILFMLRLVRNNE